jgi:CheY-like chemotaxis protein
MGFKEILVAEDNPDDAFIFKMAFKRATLPHSIHFVDDGQKVIDWLSGTGEYSNRAKFPLPSLVILDLKMPVKTGFEALQWIRSHEKHRQLPAIILSSSDDPKDVKRAYELGSTTYFIKSPDLRDVMQYLRVL